MIENSSAMDRPLPNSRRVRWLRLGIPLVLLGAAAVWLVPRVGSWMSAERSVEAGRLRYGIVVRGDLERDLSVQGRIVAAFHPTTFSPTAGIVSLRVRAGETVQEGQILADVASPAVESLLLQEQSKLASAEAALDRQKIEAKQQRLVNRQAVDLAALELEAAQRAMHRAEQSRTEGIINDVEFETAEDALRRAELGLRHAKEDADLEAETLDFEIAIAGRDIQRQRLIAEELQRRVDELSVRAPVAGLVSRVDVNESDAVREGQALVTVVDLSAFEIEVSIPESYADEIGAGTPVEIRLEGGLHPGKLRSISPEVQSGQVRGIVAFDGDGPVGLRQNQRVSTRLILESRSDVLKVDRGPFLEADGGRRAYRVDGDTAMLQDIRVGATSVNEIEIVSGLQEGDRIIVSDTARFDGAERLYLRR